MFPALGNVQYEQLVGKIFKVNNNTEITVNVNV